MIVTLDPGLNGCGVAWGTDRLLGAFYSPVEAEGPPGVRGMWAGLQAASDFLNREAYTGDLEAVTETMQVYPRGSRSAVNANPKWLLALNICAGAFAATLQGWAARQGRMYAVRMPLPREWKGTLDGDLMTERIKGLLSLREKACIDLPIKSLAHNVYDACGLYLWATGRLKKQRVIHR